MAGVYIHIPFCLQRCAYCDFHSDVRIDGREPMLDALLGELDARRDYLGGAAVDTLYIGGGTPTVYAPSAIARLIDRVAALFGVSAFAELTLEANPDDLTDSYLSALRRHTPVDRLSIGVQAFDDGLLRFFNRRHDSRQAEEAVHRAQDHGFENLSVDLIYGIPGQDDAQWEASLARFAELGAPHLSAYHLTIEEGTPLGRLAGAGQLRPVTDRTSERHYATLTRMASEAGFLHYEISNFARPGFEAVHNSNYWRGVPYLGIGPSAHSFDGARRRWNTADNDRYRTHATTGGAYEEETLTATDRFNEYLMTRLRTARGIDCADLAGRFGEEWTAGLRVAAEPFLQAGTLVEADGRMMIPPAKFLLSDAVIAALFRT